MDPKSQDSENPDPKTPSNLQSIIPFTSITLSFPKFTPTTHRHPPPTILLPTTLKIPSQIQSIFNLSIPSSTPITIPKSTISITPLHYPHSPNPRRPSDPSNAAALRRVSVVWFRSDLRLHDNESLTSANNQSISVLPVYCFDPNSLNKIGANSASFLIESVSDLRKSLRAKGSDLVVQVGKPETVLPELAKEVGAEAVYMHREVSNDEIKSEAKIETLLKDEGVEVKGYWGSTLYNSEDLQFKLEEMPTNYEGFKEKVKGVKVRNVINAADQMKGLPSCGNVDVGEVPSLADLGINHMTQVKPVNNGSLVGGETEALNRLKRFAAECRANPPKETKDGNSDSIYGASFSCKISPWLALGCVSPRAVLDEFKKSASRTISAGPSGKDGDSGMNWLMHELVWRDFFRFITRKCSSSKQRSNTPVTVNV